MDETGQILQQLAQLPARERAAALAHWIYMQAAKRTDWPTRVPTSWEQLDDKAKEINLRSMDVWAECPDVLDAWLRALSAHKIGSVADR